jgi:hypothetical protein
MPSVQVGTGGGVPLELALELVLPEEEAEDADELVEPLELAEDAEPDEEAEPLELADEAEVTPEELLAEDPELEALVLPAAGSNKSEAELQAQSVVRLEPTNKNRRPTRLFML